MKLATLNTPYFDENIPQIAIVGRPNTGKSTLFNRLLGHRKSITDPTPGVTRDPVRSLFSLYDTTTVLIDTGGLTESKEYLDSHITKKSLEAATGAQVLLFVVDVDGLDQEDHEFIKRLRKFSEKLILVVNKVDNQKRQAMVPEFFALGFKDVVACSAAHGDGVEGVLDAVAKKIGITNRTGHSGIIRTHKPGRERMNLISTEQQSAINPDKEESWNISIAIVGQPNTGKSTLTNTLTKTEMSLVSPVAGTTRDVIEGSFSYKEKVFRILDTAGIRRKAKVHEDLEYYSVNRAIASIEEADVVFLMIDADKGLADQDKKIADQIVKLGRGVILVVNKWDLMESGSDFKAYAERVRFLFPVLSFAPVIAISAMTGAGIGELLQEALKVQAQLLSRVETGKLNNMLRAWVDYTPPPTTGGAARFKCRYMTQVSAHPLEFVIFVNKKKGFPEAYVGYLMNQLRRECQLFQVPIKITLRERDQKNEN